MDTIKAEGITLSFRPEGGVIDGLVIATETGDLRPLHRAPWLDGGEVLPDHVAPVERRLAGDFFCAPFGDAGPDVPIHGWPANGTWESAGTAARTGGTMTARYRLRETVEGARLTKEIALRDGHPVVYQTHVFEGGAGKIPVAHHAMLHVPGGARLSFSPKSAGRTPSGAPEPDPARGRSILAYPQRFASLAAVRRADGGVADARLYPFDDGHEDLVALSEMPGTAIGWTAALAASDGFLFFAVKDARALPHTVLWMSNGGRSYSPWNSRHRPVIGMEEAVVGFHLAGGGDTDGLPTGLTLGDGKTTAIRYAFGAIAAPQGWTEVGDIQIAADTITLTDVGGDARVLPFDGGHFR
jgi:hypothetical protein